MKPRGYLIVLGLLATLLVPGLSEAAQRLHYFACNQCHKTGMTVSALADTVCLDCHAQSPVQAAPLNPYAPIDTRYGGTATLDGISQGTLLAADASNAMGHGTLIPSTKQTSHNWAASDTQAAAGAAAPNSATYPYFYTRYNTSVGRVTCTRCHNAHGNLDPANPSLLIVGADLQPMKPETMCVACHKTWAEARDLAPGDPAVSHGWLSHPLVTDYNAAIAGKETKFYTAAEFPTRDGANGDLQLVNGGIGCTSCHGLHYTDSSSATADGVANKGTHTTGDGKLLRTDGRTPSAVGSAAPSAILCTSCHKGYTVHGSDTPLGCLDCHSGHAYNPNNPGKPNYYVLRATIEDVYRPINTIHNPAVIGNVATLHYNAATVQAAGSDPSSGSPWMTAAGTGYCQQCHQSLTGTHYNGMTAGTAAADSCGQCHTHNNGSFQANCNDCHGNPPALDQAGTGGYASAVILGVTYDYKTTSGVYKDESKTAHSSHAGAADYSFGCSNCHLNNEHAKGSFQDVFIAPESDLATGNGNMDPVYDQDATNGTCSTVYCHSNGGGRTDGGIAVYNAAVIPYWSGAVAGNGEGAFNTGTYCQKCHGNDKASMTAAQNSATHGRHLDKGYSCNVCHVSTATSASALTGGKTLGQDHDHVDGQKDVSFQTTYSLGQGTLGAAFYTDASAGTCAVYCHSNGTTQVSPDWDLASSGACGSCHKYDADGNATQDGTGTALGGAHNAHVFLDRGPKLACTVCHVYTTELAATHVDKQVSLKTDYMTTVCNPCHGATASGIDYDAEPVWTNSGSVTCAICHVDTLAQIDYDGAGGNPARTAPAKASFYTEGHGDSGLASAPDCAGCHELTTDHIDGATDNNLLTGGATANDAFCQSCHTSPAVQAHFDKTAGGSSTPGNSCASCHEPHGEGMGTNTGAMLTKGAGYTDGTTRASFVNASFTGVCQTCHASSGPGAVNNFNQATMSTSHYGSNVCTQCHAHTTTPAFKASCTSCHGNDTTGQYWPYGSGGSIPTANDQKGRHDEHVETLSQYLYNYNTASLLADTANVDVRQKAICAYCHDNPGSGATHNAGDGANTAFHPMYNVALSDDGAIASDNCSNIACHNNKATDDASLSGKDFSWNASPGDVSECLLCHPNVTTAGAVGSTNETHLAHADASSGNYGGPAIGCTSCHAGSTAWGTAPTKAEGHWNGLWTITGSGITAYSGTWSVDSTSPGSCGTNNCHNNGRMGAPKDATYAWKTAESGCAFCHDVEGAVTDLSASHDAHFAGADVYYNSSTLAMTCSKCHTHNVPLATNKADHLNGTISLKAAMTYNSTTLAISDTPVFKDCTTSTCHENGTAAATAVKTPVWGTTVAANASCAICHSGVPSGGSHGKHAVSTPSLYGQTGNNSSVGSYDFACGECHATSLASHLDGPTSMNGGITYSTTDNKCSTSYCHSKGENTTTPTYVASPAWGTTPSGDSCAICHLNSPDTNAHQVHIVGIHNEDVYTGTTGLTQDGSARVSAHGDSATSTTLNCNSCHYNTVRSSANALNSVKISGTEVSCAKCHTTDGSPASDSAATIYDKSKHVDRVKNVDFSLATFKSKAQLRNDITAVSELNSSWQRYNAATLDNTAYKNAKSASNNQARGTLSPTFNSGTCSNIACHNGNNASWSSAGFINPTSYASDCSKCHTSLPQ